MDIFDDPDGIFKKPKNHGILDDTLLVHIEKDYRGADYVLRWNQISGFFDEYEVAAVQGLAKNKVCVEIGSFLGRSTIAISETAQKIYAVDTFKASGNGASQTGLDGFTTLRDFCLNTRGHDNIHVCVGTSEKWSKEFQDESVDLVFIDATHKYKDCTEDIFYWYKKIKKGGVLCFHDYKGWVGVTLAVDSIFPSLDGLVSSFTWKFRDYSDFVMYECTQCKKKFKSLYPPTYCCYDRSNNLVVSEQQEFSSGSHYRVFEYEDDVAYNIFSGQSFEIKK